MSGSYAAPQYRRLGMRPVVNAAATLTRLGGSRLAPPAVEAMVQAAGDFVDLPELQARVGDRIAAATGNEAAYVCSGATAGITLSVAACLADPDSREVFPVLGDGQRVAMHRGQRNAYDYAARQLGAEIVEFGADPASMRRVIGSSTACVLWFAGAHYADGAPALSEIVTVARHRGVPVLVDAAAQIPPISSLWDFTTGAGADAAVFSGGKGLRGPQSTGLVLGRRRIVEGCRGHGSPHHAVGRGMKVGKEELLGVLAAVEWALDGDEPALLAGYERSVDRWLEGLRGLPGLRVERGFPSEAGQPHSRAILRLEPSSGWTRDGLAHALWERDPRIAVAVVGDAVVLNPQTLDPGEDVLVLDAVRELLGSAGERRY